MLRESHELNFQKNIATSGGLDIQATKKRLVAKGKGKKTTPLETIKVLEDVTRVDYESQPQSGILLRSMMDLKGDNLANTLTFCLIVIDHLHFAQNYFWFHHGEHWDP